MDLDQTLREVFGLEDFRPGQRTVVEAVLAGRPTIAVMPTGAGKSLCYQLPAVMAGGTALVVSPLIALMKDQVDGLRARGVAAVAITSALSQGEQAAALEQVASGQVRLLYVAPERFKNGRFEEALSGVPISLLAVDEAHCISEWGHDFRPDYMRLGEVAARLKAPRLVALTATATPEVRRDIVKQLGMQEPAVFVRGFDRPNLSFRVEKIGGAAAKGDRLVELARAATGPVLVYAATRKNAENYAEELSRRGLRAAAYHAGLEDGVRGTVQDAFMLGRLQVVVATNAFGMGVDKADVRLVVHADLPRSPEAYYQEAGRGGRDGDPAECVLLFNHSDVKLQEFLIEASSPSVDLLRQVWRAIRTDPRCGVESWALRRALPGRPGEAAIGSATRFLEKLGYLREAGGGLEAVVPPSPQPKLDPEALAARADVERGKLRAMVDYAYATGCRRRFILTYFGDEDAGQMRFCGGCDVCSGAGRRALDPEEMEHARVALRLIDKMRGRFGRTRIAGLLAGDEGEDGRFAELPERGALRRQGARYAMDVVRALEGAGLIDVSQGEYPTLSITRRGQVVADGHEEVELALARAGEGKERKRRGGKTVVSIIPDNAPPPDPGVIESLRRLRRELAAREALPPYCVFADKTIVAIARARPVDLPALGDVYGIGPAKLEKYGDAILAAVRAAG